MIKAFTRSPQFLVGIVAAVTLSQVHAYILCYFPFVRPLIWGAWSLVGIAALAAIAIPYLYKGEKQSVNGVDLKALQGWLVIGVLLVLIWICLGFGLEQIRLGNDFCGSKITSWMLQ